jgi:hypothetical protein
MSRKPKFKPAMTRVKLNPEQAVLTCTCHWGMVIVALAGLDGYYCRSDVVDRHTYQVCGGADGSTASS